ncbi:MAG: hypothetical protein ACTSWR_07130, partial [Candidatus Helarchaeota archaeon]
MGRKMEDLKRVVDDIHKIKIQGATNIAMTGIKAFSDYIQSVSIDNLKTLKKEIEKAQSLLSNARP